jgi:hypothetical protein
VVLDRQPLDRDDRARIDLEAPDAGRDVARLDGPLHAPVKAHPSPEEQAARFARQAFVSQPLH